MLVSGSAPTRTMSLVDELRVQEAAWHRRPLVRQLYHSWYDLIVAQLSTSTDRRSTSAAASAGFKEHFPAATTSDVEPTPWADRVVDAEGCLSRRPRWRTSC